MNSIKCSFPVTKTSKLTASQTEHNYFSVSVSQYKLKIAIKQIFPQTNLFFHGHLLLWFGAYLQFAFLMEFRLSGLENESLKPSLPSFFLTLTSSNHRLQSVTNSRYSHTKATTSAATTKTRKKTATTNNKTISSIIFLQRK